MENQKELYGIYYGSREYAKEAGDPLLDVVEACSKEEAERATTVSGMGAGLWAVPISFFDKTDQHWRVEQIKGFWNQKNVQKD